MINDARWGATDQTNTLFPAGNSDIRTFRREFVRAAEAPGACKWVVNSSLLIQGASIALFSAITGVNLEMTVRTGVGANTVLRKYARRVLAPLFPNFTFLTENPGVSDLYFEVSAEVPGQHVSVDILSQVVTVGLAVQETRLQELSTQIAPNTPWQQRIGKPKPMKRHELEELGQRQRLLQAKMNLINR